MVKVIFTHNVYDRSKTLRETMEIERSLFPESEIFIAYNHPNFPKDKFLEDFNGIGMVSFDERTHKIGCTNGFMFSLKMCAGFNADVVVFTHDDVRINKDYLNVFNKHLQSIKDGEYDVIVRKPKYNYGDNYYMMEGVFMSKKVVEKISKKFLIFNNEEEIPKDVRGSISPEVFLYETLNDGDFNIKVFEYDNRKEEKYNTLLGETLGLFHKNIGKRGWKE